MEWFSLILLEKCARFVVLAAMSIFQILPYCTSKIYFIYIVNIFDRSDWLTELKFKSPDTKRSSEGPII